MSQLTFLAVHAHPDDEASSTGGLYRSLANQGVRTILVTCTNGECGDSPAGAKPDSDEHDMEMVAAVRKVELENAVAILGIDRLVRLGYHDSGMMGWPHNSHDGSFWGTPVEEAAKRLAEILMEERPQVLVTYNEIGFYGHPDHIQANRITLAALAMIDYEPTLYYNAIPDSVFEEMRKRWDEEDEARREEGKSSSALKEVEEEIPEQMSTPDELISAAIDISSVNSVKFDALAAHASQIADSFWMKMGREAFCETNKTEWFLRVTNPQKVEGCVTDIFAGYR